ncbi:MAG: subfamily B ATP-binding cassette protein MsbA [Sphingobacteriales bacterium]|jgi:subfamily B ATP-binding cassette protein MsbA
MKKLRRIVALLVPFKSKVALNVGFNILSALFSLFSFASAIPFLKILFTNGKALAPEKLESDDLLDRIEVFIWNSIETYGQETTLTYLCLGIIVVFTFKNVFRYLGMHQLAFIRNGVVRNLRDSIHAKMLKLPLRFYNQERKGDLMSRFTNDVSEVEWSVIGSIEMIFRDPFTLLLYLTTMIWMNWELTLFVFILLPLSGGLISIVGNSLKKRARRGQKQFGDVLSILEEHIGGMRIIKGFNAEKTAGELFQNSNHGHFTTMVKLFRKQFLASPISEFLGAASLVTVLWFGGNMILSGEGAFDGAFFIGYLVIFSQLIPPAKSFTEAIFRIKKGSAALDRIEEVLHAPEEKNLHIPMEPIQFDQNISLRNISFSYNSGHKALENINLEINKGETIALVGPSGGGKSTLSDLICGFIHPDEGEISVDGKSYQELSPKSIRELFAIVPQEPILFNATVRSNIALGKPEIDADLKSAAKIAHADEFIVKLKDGDKTTVGERGNNLSGGQKQRISIARAVYKNPPIMVFDEATSALDTQSEKWVQEALNTMLQNHTAIVIAHRLSTIQNADKIVVIDEGKVVETGNHQSLIAKGGLYAKLCTLQNID